MLLRYLIVLVAAAFLSVASARLASAATATGTQNPTLTVTVTTDRDVATVGDTVTASYTVTNTSAKKQVVTVTRALEQPNGQIPTQTDKLRLGPGESVTESATYVIEASTPKGTYVLSVSASAQTGTSSAQVSLVLT